MMKKGNIIIKTGKTLCKRMNFKHRKNRKHLNIKKPK